ncbi:unnamed protein product [Linum trigynum]|uniref:TF-B3 domain-containing protein n=1 Tax=Linum trigynum TaxID=586398 RepID=A0AAV2GG33_9ROSI
MTSSGERRPDDHGSNLVGARFFKIILQETVRDKKLLIPSRFVTNCGEGLSNSAILKVPSGLSWTVGLVRDEIGVWFRNGWQDFAEFHSLRYGHFLVFEYKGCSSFYVVICDRTAAEIEYPITRTASNQQPATDETGSFLLEPKVEVIEDVSDEVDAPQRCKGKPPVEVSQYRGRKNEKKNVRGSSSRNGKVRMESCSKESAEGHESSAQGIGSNSVELGVKEEEGGDEMIHEEPPFVRGRKPITGFTSPHPFFDCRMTSSTLSRKQLYLPAGFSVRHIRKDEISLKLQVADKTWPVALVRCTKDKYVYFSDGWLEFAEQNSLKPGDICIFECVHRWTNVLLKVTIVREC